MKVVMFEELAVVEMDVLHSGKIFLGYFGG